MSDITDNRFSTQTQMSTVSTYTEYAAARAAVDTLSDRGFDVSSAEIVWNGLHHVERVTGRRTVPVAALEGAGAGTWFGAFIGVLSAIFIDTDGIGETIAVVLTYALIGALVGAIWFGAMHWSTRGRRDFTSYPVLTADSYDVRVDSRLHDEAATILGITRSRPIDPPPARA